MITFTEVFLIFIVALLLVMFIQNHYGEVEYVRSSIDGRLYLVRKLPDSQQAADYLADVNAKLRQLVQHMMAKSPGSPEVLQMYKNYNPDAISEGSPDSGYTSYTVNKGEKLVICIRQKDNSFVEKNVCLYPAIHELAHIMTMELGHTERFWSNFKLLLKESMILGIYKRVDFTSRPHDYCGIKITNTIV